MNVQVHAGAVTIPAAQLAAFVAKLFAATGLSAAAAEKVASGLVDADLEGLASHGVMLADMYIERLQEGSVSKKTGAAVVSERHGAVVLDAGNALGQSTGDQAMTLAIDKARQFAAASWPFVMGFILARRRYARQAANAGCVWHRDVQHASADACPGRRRARLSAIIPSRSRCRLTAKFPSCLTWRRAKRRWARYGWLKKPRTLIRQHGPVTAQGLPTTNPAEAIAGMLLPSGGAKGFRLSFLIDLLCGCCRRARAGRKFGPLYGDSACLTIARTCSLRSMLRIFAISVGSAPRRRTPRSVSAAANERRASPNCSRRENRSGSGAIALAVRSL